MKSISLIAATLLAAVSASPFHKRIVAQEFDVSDFAAGCIPHGTLCTISFKVATNQMPFATSCSASVQTAFDIPDVPFTACEDPSVIWSFQGVGLPDGARSNYTLVLADAEQSLAAAKIWPASDFPVLDDGSTTHQQYQGEQRFVVQ